MVSSKKAAEVAGRERDSEERLPLERMLKHTRTLAREQFVRRALARRIGDGLGWTM